MKYIYVIGDHHKKIGYYEDINIHNMSSLKQFTKKVKCLGDFSYSTQCIEQTPYEICEDWFYKDMVFTPSRDIFLGLIMKD